MNTDMLTGWTQGQMPFDPEDPQWQQRWLADQSTYRKDFNNSLIGRNMQRLMKGSK